MIEEIKPSGRKGGYSMSIMFPIGLESFPEIRDGGFYYIDKTGFIKALLSTQFKANLITRPRRFGKTLTMSMLEDFFDISRNSEKRFEKLFISQDVALCKQWMNQWPVLFVTLKSVEGLDFESAYSMLVVLVANLCKKYAFLGQSDRVDEDDKILFQSLKGQRAGMENVKDSLLLLTRMMHAHYGRPAILLIDEYDVPLAKADDHGYYTEMLDVIRAMIGNSLKTNPYLKFSVLTGCLRIAKESIFTGTNLFVTDSISDARFDEYLGFTEQDVSCILSDIHAEDHAALVKEWYNGYLFGNVHVYCPWDVLNYASALSDQPDASPKTYWANTSGNSILKRFFQATPRSTKLEIERLIAGEKIIRKINEELTYNEIDKAPANLWSFLYLTGYLTGRKLAGSDKIELIIPNREIREIFLSQISEWFTDSVITGQHEKWEHFCNALKQGDADAVQTLFTGFLRGGISIRDTFVRRGKKENFYHGILLGLLMSTDSWYVHSNSEDGDGYSDIHVEINEENTAFIIEVKYAENGEFTSACETALKQIQDLKYAENLKNLGYETIYSYGIACYKKECRIVCRKEDSGN